MATTTDDQRPELFDGERIEEILVPIRAGYADERGAAIAGRYASMWGVPVRLLHVTTGDDDDSIGVDTAKLALTSAHPDIVVDAVEMDADDVPTGIARAASRQSLVLLASDHGSQWAETGSVGEAVLHQTEQMIVLCGPHCHEPPVGTSVIVPLDGSPRAESALQPALAMAGRHGVKLWVVTSVSSATSETVADLRAKGERVSESGYVRAIADSLAESGVDVGWEVVHNEDPVAGIVGFAQDRGSSMVVAATHGDTGMAKRLFGSVCLGLVERGPIPVMVVRTDTRDAAPLLAGSN